MILDPADKIWRFTLIQKRFFLDTGILWFENIFSLVPWLTLKINFFDTTYCLYNWRRYFKGGFYDLE